MLGHPPFYHKHFKKYISIFGTLFNDIEFVREPKDPGGTPVRVKVPLAFADKDNFLAKLRQDPELAGTWRNSLPRMAFTMGSPQYDHARKEIGINYTSKDIDGRKAEITYSPAPYNIPFTLSILCNYYEDGLQIVEQILPFFQPDYTVSVKEVPELDIKRDVHIVLDSVDVISEYEGEFDNARLIEWTLNFTLKGFIYGPSTVKDVIKISDSKTFFDPDLNQAVTEYKAEVDPITATEQDPHSIVETRDEY